MVKRRFWINKIEKAWKKRSVLWLSGVRRVGKTYLCQSLSDIEYFDCELPRVRRLMDDPQGFLEDLKGRRIVLDEIHRLSNPSELLKIAADHYPGTRVLATGSSTLGASAKFRDTLTGRKEELWLTPMIGEDLVDFEKEDLEHRFLFGGLPPYFLSGTWPEGDYQEWVESFWARDIQELFRLERRSSFLRFVELLSVQSGGIFEASRFAAPCEVSRTSISNYLAVLEATFAVSVIRPFSTRKANEIVSAPKVYGFDTGFSCFFRGWHELRREDLGRLWEQYVLNEMQAHLQTRKINYWRSKQGHEIDFVLVRHNRPQVAIECKWSADDFETRNLKAFRRRYPEGRNLVTAADVDRSFTRSFGDLKVKFVSLAGLIRELRGNSNK
ncbi:MAG: ATP-binding protein [Planctomycetota bacterium]|jgi:predicted AAA+ superfamily ATPase